MNALVSLVLATLLAPTAIAAPDRAHPPTPGPIPAFTVAAPEKLALSNGIPVYFLERHRAPLVDVVVGVRAGAITDPSDRPGTASWTGDILTEGAGTRGALELSDAINLLGASLSSGASWDAALVSLHIAASRIEPGLSLLADVVQRPRFEPAEWARNKAEHRTGFLEARDNPRALSRLANARALFGDTHRFGTDVDGTLASLEQTEVKDLRAFHESRYRPENTFIVVVGDLDRARALKLLEARFGTWKPAGATTPKPVVTRVAPLAGREIVLVDKPGAPQSVVSVVRHAPADLQAFDAPADVMNTLLGGSFTSRLNSNLREEHGYAYGARSGIDLRQQSSTFAAQASVATPVTAQSVTEILNELTRIRTAAKPDEIERARQYAALTFPTAFQNGARTAHFWAQLVVDETPFEAARTFMARAGAVDSAAVAVAAKRVIDPEAVRIVVVGDRKTVEPALQALKLGPVRVISIDALLPSSSAPAKAEAPATKKPK